ncbi:uncharacterized protein coa1 isoform X2 [Mobula birostris]|uniref:uncharacterized protein coa1 isoform X2 n=1 Tax=Mobula birostris TaxID=1983395 RepID=UPI003B289583
MRTRHDLGDGVRSMVDAAFLRHRSLKMSRILQSLVPMMELRGRAQSGFDGDSHEKHGGTPGVTSEMSASLPLLPCDRESPEMKAPNPRLCLLPGPGSKRSAEMVLGAGELVGGSEFSDGLGVGLWLDASNMLHRQVGGAGGLPSV